MELEFIGDCSNILGTIITPSGKLRAKNDKNGPKLILKKLRKNCVVFFVHFLYLFS